MRTKAIGAVIVYDPNRLSRNLGHQLLLAEEFERGNVQLLIVSHPMEDGPEGMLFFQMRDAFAEYERAKTWSAPNAGLWAEPGRGRSMAGGPHWAIAISPAGTRGQLEIDKEEAAHIRQIFQWVLDGCSVRAIARRLTAARIPTATDRRGFIAAEGRQPCKQEPRGIWSLSS